MKNRITKITPALLALSACFAGASLSAQTTFLSDTFNTYAMGNLPVSSPGQTGNWFNRSSTNGRSVTVELDSGNLFGEGATNKILRITRDNTATANLDLTGNFSSVTAQLTGQVSFDFYGDIDGAQGLRFTLHKSDGLASPGNYSMANAVAGFHITDTQVVRKATNGAGLDTNNVFTYTTGQKNTVSIVFNNSASALAYGNTSVASGFADLYLNGVKQATWELGQGSAAGVGNGVAGMYLWVPTGTTADMRLDNILFTAAPEVIPEPAAFALLGAAGALAFAGARRRRRAL